MTPHILIIVAIVVIPVNNKSHVWVTETWSNVTMQRFEDRAACEHAAKQIRAMAAKHHDLRMTCQPVAIK